MRETAEDGKRVLAYLKDMIELSRNSRRQDMVWLYEDAWEVAASTIFGPLPPRRESVMPPRPEPEPKARTFGQVEMVSKPFRKIVARFTAIEGDLQIDYEQLACGHRVMAKVDLPGDPQARRRRCAQCAREAASDKKHPSSVICPSKKGATA